MNSLTKALSVVSIAMGSLLLSSGPALASISTPDIVAWHEVGETDANWKCGTVTDHPAADGIRFRACIIRNELDMAQAVLVLVNNSGRKVQIHGETNTTIRTSWNPSRKNLADVDCASSPLNTGFQVGCFSRTKRVEPSLSVKMRLNINGHVKTIEYSRPD